MQNLHIIALREENQNNSNIHSYCNQICSKLNIVHSVNVVMTFSCKILTRQAWHLMINIIGFLNAQRKM
jgi:hypothetical protein